MATQIIDPFASELYLSGDLQNSLNEIIAAMTLEVDFNGVLTSQTLNDSEETLTVGDSDAGGDDFGTVVFPNEIALTIKGTESDQDSDQVVVITGLDADGNVVTDSISAAGAAQVQGTTLFKSVTSIVMPAYTTDSDETLVVGWDLIYQESPAIVIPGGQADLTFFVKANEVSSAGNLTIAWFVSWDNSNWFLLTSAPLATATILEAAMGSDYLIAYGPDEITAPFIKMRLTAASDIDETDKIAVQAWVGRNLPAAQ